MKQFALFVQFQRSDERIWMFSGFATENREVQQFINDVFSDIEITKDLDFKTLSYRVVTLTPDI